jgi:hypothetical protein
LQGNVALVALCDIFFCRSLLQFVRELPRQRLSIVVSQRPETVVVNFSFERRSLRVRHFNDVLHAFDQRHDQAGQPLMFGQESRNGRLNMHRLVALATDEVREVFSVAVGNAGATRKRILYLLQLLDQLQILPRSPHADYLHQRRQLDEGHQVVGLDKGGQAQRLPHATRRRRGSANIGRRVNLAILEVRFDFIAKLMPAFSRGAGKEF